MLAALQSMEVVYTGGGVGAGGGGGGDGGGGGGSGGGGGGGGGLYPGGVIYASDAMTLTGAGRDNQILPPMSSPPNVF